MQNLFFKQSCLRGVVAFFCLSVFWAAQAVGQSPTATPVTAQTLDSLRSYLNRGASERYLSFEQVMASAERAFAKTDYDAVQRYLSRATIAGVPNSRWFELRYRTLLALGQSEAAQEVLVQGFSRYPYAENLARLVGGQAIEANATRTTLLKSKYPTNVRFELAAKLAFRQGDVVSALLDAEQAFYSDDKLQLDTALRRQLVLFYRNLLLARGDTKSIVQSSLYADSSFAKAYLNCLSEAAQKVYDASGLESGEFFEDQYYLSKVRVSALRIYVRKGHLGRWQHPLLVDLYVLDKAGHFEETSLILLDLLGDEITEAYLRANPGKLELAVNYLNVDWSKDVDAFLSSF